MATVSELHDELAEAIEAREPMRAARVAVQLQTADPDVEDLLPQLGTAVRNEEHDKGKTLTRSLKRQYADLRVDQRVETERLAHARDVGALSPEEREQARAHIQRAQATTMERFGFLGEVTTYLSQPKGGDPQSVASSAESLTETEAELADSLDTVSGLGGDVSLPPNISLVSMGADDPVSPGESVTVTGELRNLGDEPATEIDASAAGSEGLSVVEVSEVGELSGSDAAEVTATASASEPGSYGLTLTVEAAAGGSTVEDTTVRVESAGTPSSSSDPTDQLPDWALGAGLGAAGLAGALATFKYLYGEDGAATE